EIIRRAPEEMRGGDVTFSSHLMDAVLRYDWRGNVRELENVIARYVVLGSEEALFPEGPTSRIAKPAFAVSPGSNLSLKHIARQATRQIEQEAILKALQNNQWNRRKAAQVLKISYRALLYKVRQAGLPAKRPRQKADAEVPIDVSSQPRVN
ncbi:MAG: hypothetical protein KGL75_08735, partial [Acidobacteriota bacterium]|nr:hypothetical protein [Acidobacteriota bacterium]